MNRFLPLERQETHHFRTYLPRNRLVLPLTLRNDETDHPVNLADENVTLDQCLYEHTKEETLDEGNEWYCSNCKAHKLAKKIVKFWRPRLPEVLILSLKRFEFRDVSELMPSYSYRPTGHTHREKIDTFVDFPLDGLDLAPYCMDESFGQTSLARPRSRTLSMHQTEESDYYDSDFVSSDDEDDESVHSQAAKIRVAKDSPNKSNGKSEYLYDLFAVCNHYGRMGFGHYTASARDIPGWGEEEKSMTSPEDSRGMWFSFDDECVSRHSKDSASPKTKGTLASKVSKSLSLSDEEVKSKSAYILFYKRRNSPTRKLSTG